MTRVRFPSAALSTPPHTVELYWLPLGAGSHLVKWSGRAVEATVARVQGRSRRALFHSALLVRLDGRTYGIEQTPAWGREHELREVVAAGPVGARWAGRLKLFRYEVHIAPGGGIPDLAYAVDSPRPLAAEEEAARRVLEAVRAVPALTWGRDELGLGEMWNSNSVVAWALTRAGIDAAAVGPPAGGAAPGWGAGLELARAGDVRPG